MLESYDPHDLFGRSQEEYFREKGRERFLRLAQSAQGAADAVARTAGRVAEEARRVRERSESARSVGYFRDDTGEGDAAYLTSAMARMLAAREELEQLIADLAAHVALVTAPTEYPAPYGTGPRAPEVK